MHVFTWRSIAPCAFLGLLLACATPIQQLHKRAAFDLSCPPESIELIEIDDNNMGVRGCGQQAVYYRRCSDREGTYMGDDCSWLLDPGSLKRNGQPVATTPPPRPGAAGAAPAAGPLQPVPPAGPPLQPAQPVQPAQPATPPAPGPASPMAPAAGGQPATVPAPAGGQPSAPPARSY